MSVYEQVRGKTDVNSFFGNLKNGRMYEGFWGCLTDDNRVWLGTRNGAVPADGKIRMWDETNPLVVAPEPLEENRFYLVMGRMGAGQGVVDLDLFINSIEAVERKKVPVNPEANPSMMAIGQERDATNHPGFESFSGEITRLLMYDRALTDEELSQVAAYLIDTYRIKSSDGS